MRVNSLSPRESPSSKLKGSIPGGGPGSTLSSPSSPDTCSMPGMTCSGGDKDYKTLSEK